MSMFNLSITLDNDAMQTGDDVADALHKVAATLANRYDSLILPDDSGSILDLDGNTVGRWEVSA